MPPRPLLSFQPFKDFGNTMLFYLSILPLALANPNVLKDPDSRRDGRKECAAAAAAADEGANARRKDGVNRRA